jgi:hypothetical protein
MKHPQPDSAEPATPEQIAARNSPATKEVKATFARMLSDGLMEIIGERWSDRTGRFAPIYGLTAKGAESMGMSPTKLDGTRRQFTEDASSPPGLTEADLRYRGTH